MELNVSFPKSFEDYNSVRPNGKNEIIIPEAVLFYFWGWKPLGIGEHYWKTLKLMRARLRKWESVCVLWMIVGERVCVCVGVVERKSVWGWAYVLFYLFPHKGLSVAITWLNSKTFWEVTRTWKLASLLRFKVSQMEQIPLWGKYPLTIPMKVSPSMFKAT